MKFNSKEAELLRKDDQIKFANINKIKFFYNNYSSAIEIYKEIFINNIYDFKTDKLDPTIIDAGSNIGLAALFFKKRYAKAKITCFEPDPYVFPILSLNVSMNKLDQVELVNAAISKKNGFVPLYGELGPEADTRGNSIIDVWGRQRNTSDSILVRSVQLSSYVTQEVDLLKLDVEGAEQQVLEEIEDKLYLIKNILLEVHEAQGMDMMNSLNKITLLLEKFYNLTIKEIDIKNAFPTQVGEWSRLVLPRLFMIKGERK